MKHLKINKQYLTVAVYAVGVSVAAILFGLAVFNLGDIFAFLGRALGAIMALPYGILFALILYPFVNLATPLFSRLLERKRPHPRLVSFFSLFTVYLGMVLVVAIILLSVIPPMIDTVGELVTLVGETLTDIETYLRQLTAGSGVIAELVDTAIGYAKENFFGLLPSDDVAGLATSLLTGIVGETFDILVGLIISLYLLAGRRLVGAICGKTAAALLPAGGNVRFTMFIKRLYSNFTEFISARILSALFLGTASYLLFLVFGIPFYPLLALTIAVCNLFPVFGTVFSMLICSVVLLITRPIYALPVLLILIGLELVDNLLIEPRTMIHKTLRPNVGVTIALMLVGYAMLGLFGMLIAIPVFATVQNALRSFTVHLLNRRHLPTAIEEYEHFDPHEYIARRKAEEAEKAAEAPAEADAPEAPEATGE